jgi:hypothetical protein
MAVKPVVDGIEREHEGKLVVIRVNVQDEAGKTLSEEYGFVYTPTFLFFDGSGTLEWRTVGAIDPAQVRRSLATP